VSESSLRRALFKPNSPNLKLAPWHAAWRRAAM